MDKIRVINEGGVGRKMVGAGGPIGDVHQFCDFVERNMYLYQLVHQCTKHQIIASTSFLTLSRLCSEIWNEFEHARGGQLDQEGACHCDPVCFLRIQIQTVRLSC